MIYKNGEQILPSKLLKELQKYVQGEIIYIPKESKERAPWGEISGTKNLLISRNHQIYTLYKNGTSVREIATQFCLSEDSIKKIIIKLRKVH